MAWSIILRTLQAQHVDVPARIARRDGVAIGCQGTTRQRMFSSEDGESLPTFDVPSRERFVVGNRGRPLAIAGQGDGSNRSRMLSQYLWIAGPLQVPDFEDMPFGKFGRRGDEPSSILGYAHRADCSDVGGPFPSAKFEYALPGLQTPNPKFLALVTGEQVPAVRSHCRRDARLMVI